MQTMLGASGQIGHELARTLIREFTSDIRLVSRNPQKVNEPDHLHSPDLLDAARTMAAVEGSDIVYLTTGLPVNTKLWVGQWPVLMQNVIDACAKYGAKLACFENAYMYPQTSQPQSQNKAFAPHGARGRLSPRKRSPMSLSPTITPTTP